MITINDESIKYTAFMYETPYKLLAIEGQSVNSRLYSKKKTEDEDSDEVVYTFCLAKDNRNEEKPEHIVSSKLCGENQNELELFLAKPVLNYAPYTQDGWERSIEKLMLDLHNQARLDYADIETPMSYDAKLEMIAQQHAEYMARTGDYGHTTQDGVSVLDRYINNNYIPGEGFFVYGENILYRVEEYSKYYGTEDMVKDMFLQWKNSPPHWENILRDNFDRIGFGYSLGVRNIDGKPYDVVYGVVNFAGGGSGGGTNKYSVNTKYSDIVGHKSLFELLYDSQENSSEHNVDGDLLGSIKLTFTYKLPFLCAINHLSFKKTAQSTSYTSVYWHYTDKGVIGKDKKDALQLAGKEYKYSIIDWDDFSTNAPGMFYFADFSIDNYAGDYPDSIFGQTTSRVVYIGTFLNLFGLTGGRITDINTDANGVYVYTIDIENDTYFAYASGYETYNLWDYVVVSKSNDDVNASTGFNLIGDGRDNSPDNIFGYNIKLNSKSIKGIDKEKDIYYILPISSLDLPI